MPATARSGPRDLAAGGGCGGGGGADFLEGFDINNPFYRDLQSTLKFRDQMALFTRRDKYLVGGLALALVVVFAQPLGHLLDAAREVERNSGLALLPALIILTAVF